MNEPIVVLGGTGAIGQEVARRLSGLGHPVTIASRSPDRATNVAAKIQGASPLTVDLTDADPLTGAGSPGVVVDCTGIEAPMTTQRLLNGGWSVVDITADARHTADLLGLDVSGTALLAGVGLMPGLSTLAAEVLHGRHPMPRAITMSALIGLGDDYGPASKAWTYSQLGRPLTIHPEIRGFTQSEMVDFPGGFGRRRAWQVDFADQVLLRERLGIKVTTRYCFDSRLAGSALALAARVPAITEFLTAHPNLTKPPPRSTDWYAFVAETDTGARLTAMGRSQATSTATLVALATARLAESDRQGHLATPDLLDLDDVITDPSLELLVAMEPETAP